MNAFTYIYCKYIVQCMIYIPLLATSEARAIPPNPYKYEQSLKYSVCNFKYVIKRQLRYDTMEIRVQTFSGI